MLQWDRSAQIGFVQTSISMAGVVAAQIRPEIARCIDARYFVNEVMLEQRSMEIIGRIAEHTAFHPSAVVLVAVQNECGAFRED